MTKILQPALIIGLGGSGTEVVRRFKRRFQTTYGQTPYIQLLGIDTAPEEEETDERPFLGEDNFIYAANFNSDFFVGDDHIDRHPAIREWWTGFKLPTKLITAGAGMRRPFGRLALYVHFDTVVARIRSHLHEIFNNDRFSQLPAHYRGALNVYIVASTCGGTGTGMFLDLAYLMQTLVPQVMPRTEVWVRGVMLLPSVFLDTGQVKASDARGLRANGWGALTELDGCISKRSTLPPIRFPRGVEAARSRSPFHSCFLLGSQTAEGAVVTDFGALLERAAVHMQIELASPIMETGKARLDNPLEAIAAKPDSQGKPRLYSSFSNEWLELPQAKVITRWSRLLALDVVERLADETRDTAAGAKLDQQDAYGKLRAVWAGQGLKPYFPRVDSYIDHLMDLGEDGREPAVLIERARALQTEAARQIDNSSVTDVVRDHIQRVPAEVIGVAAGLLQEKSVYAAQSFVSDTVDELSGWLGTARNETGGAQSHGWLDTFQQNAQTTKKGVLTRSAAFAAAQRQLVIDAVEAARDAWRRALRAKIALELEKTLPAVIASLRQLRDHTEQLRLLLEGARPIVAGVRDPVVPRGVGSSTVTDDDIDAEFRSPESARNLSAAVREPLAAVLTEDITTAEELAKALWEIAYRAVLQVAPGYLSTLDIPASAIAEQLAKLSPLAVFRPDWVAHPDGRDVHRLWLVGLPESSAEKQPTVRAALPPHTREITEFVLHRDEGRVIMTVQHHGFPLYSLAEIDACKAEFEQTDAVRKRLSFIYPDEFLQQWSLHPASGSASRQWFAVSIALGSTRRVGQDYVYRAGGVEYQLGGHADLNEARRRARDEFMRAGLASEVETIVNKRLRAEGNEPMYAELSAWVRDQQQRMNESTDYPEEFAKDVELVAAFAAQIRPV